MRAGDDRTLLAEFYKYRYMYKEHIRRIVGRNCDAVIFKLLKSGLVEKISDEAYKITPKGIRYLTEGVLNGNADGKLRSSEEHPLDRTKK